MCQLNVYRGNPADGCYFHQEGNDKGMKANDDQDGLLPRLLCLAAAMERAVLNGFAKCLFKPFLNFSYKEQLTVSFISF